MKKLLVLAAFAATLVSASGAALNWGWGSGSLFLAEEGDTAGVSAASFTGDTSNLSLALVYLGQNVSSYTAADITADKVVSTMAYDYSGDSEESFWKPQYSSFSVTESGGYSSGATFGIAVKNGDAFALASDISDWDAGTLGGTLAPLVTLTDLSANAGVKNMTVTGISTDSAAAAVVPTSVPPVPEPATGALALAGIALLFKRRKA